MAALKSIIRYETDFLHLVLDWWLIASEELEKLHHLVTKKKDWQES